MNTRNISLSTNEKMGLVSNMNTMLSAGIPILETVDSLLEGAKNNQKKLLEVLRDDLTQGRHVYESFEKFPKVFDKVTINLLKASEEAGTLEITLKDLKSSIQKESEFSDKIKSALFYPMVILVVFGLVMLLMLTFVIPRISTVFLRLKVELPLPTRILIFVSDLILKYTVPTVIVTAVIVGGLIFLYKVKKRLIMEIFFSFPVVSKLVREIDLTRFSRSMYLLLSSGIPITTSLDLAKDVVLKSEIKKIIERSHEMVSAGKKMSEGLITGKGIIPSIVIKIIEAGEKTGSLDKSLQDTSEYLDYEVSNTLKSLTVLLEPLMLVFVGILIGGMMLAIIAPIYGLISQVVPK